MMREGLGAVISHSVWAHLDVTSPLAEKIGRTISD